jgi:hypothetical protein
MSGEESEQEYSQPEQPRGSSPVVMDGKDEAHEGYSRKKIAQYSRCIWEWVTKFSEPLTVVTLLLFGATVALYFATRDLVHDAQHTSERQLRAYICIIGVQKVSDPYRTGTMAARITIKNCGQTPAYDFVFNAHLEWSGDKAVPNSVFTTATVVGPGADEVYIRKLEARLTANQIDEIESDKNFVYFIGNIEFKDAFGKNRFVKVRWVLNAEGNRIGNFAELENTQN